ncbi:MULTISPECIES: LysR family transcriptional regulator [unclassified Acinetobacter]|uniref:LysR family transcriptional regulator n=1 Tax=unclassified Acinetobacter TaxID=196816 RepID=UPI00257542EC|nr:MULTISPECIES: LysR family transcriptional regulator [unclassified Acinetobacter]MDM1759158.1 LysR family transcriptional regulator [Acinetobacter sp. 256-1]MDM1760227.1 LysR family transcriptional regulator [Acinetobacter sp. 251-1]
MNRHFDDLQIGSLEIFCLTVELGSFTAAAVSLGVTPAAVSRSISRIEERLGAKLFVRTTRQLRVTEEGKNYYYHCRKALEYLIDAESLISGKQQELSGTLRISVPTAYAHYKLLPNLYHFSEQYPKLKFEIHVSNQNVDLIAQDYDLAIRGNYLPDSGLIARKLEDAALCIVATPNYLKKHPAPLHPGELKDHECIQFEIPSTGKSAMWTFYESGAEISVAVQGRMLCQDDYLSTLTLVKTGVGLMQVYRFTVEKELKQGSLVEVLQEYNQTSRPFYLLYAQAKYQPLKVRVFMDYLLSSVY